MPARFSKASPPNVFRLERSIFLRWLNAAAVTLSISAHVMSAGRFARGVRRTTEESTLGGGVKASA